MEKRGIANLANVVAVQYTSFIAAYGLYMGRWYSLSQIPISSPAIPPLDSCDFYLKYLVNQGLNGLRGSSRALIPVDPSLDLAPF